MKKVLLFSFLICLFIIQGCAGGQWINAKFTPINPTPGGYVKNYTLGETKTAFIGQEIIKVEMCDYFQKNVISSQGIYVDAKYDKFRKLYINTESNKSPISIIGTVEFDGETFYLTDILSDNSRRKWGLLISSDGNVYKKGIFGIDYLMMFIPDSINITPDRVEYLPICIREKSSSVSYEVIFAGKNDISLNATYKEYTVKDLARPSFFQNLTYQANAKQIRFKNFLIQIHNATNEKITYTVLEDGLK